MIKIKDILYVRYATPDLQSMKQFLQDFGMSVAHENDSALYMAGAGDSPFVHVSEKAEQAATLGFALAVESRDDLVEIAALTDTPVLLNEEPCGGEVVRILDPFGFRIDFLWGYEKRAEDAVRLPYKMNPSSERSRYGNPIRVVRNAPSTVMRCGHVALLVSDFAKAMQFYTETLGLKVSDTYFDGTETNLIGAFLHCDHGDEFTDHHTIALVASPQGESRFDHSAFEVIDLDDLMLGNDHLESCGYNHAWGVGRHVQGSQLFDYWRDPCGHKIEHWTDGDLVNDQWQVTTAQITPDELAQWAPEFSPEFFK
jgi:catechol 2,3-dioxygenase-like lactoylglutathione lyase family enzyme